GETNNDDDCSQLFAEDGEPLLEWSLLILYVHKAGNLANLGIHSRSDDYRFCRTITHDGAFEDHILLVTGKQVFTRDDVSDFSHRSAFTGKRGLFGFKSVSAEKPGIGRYDVAGLKHNDVAGNKFRSIDLFGTAVPDNGRGLGRHLLEHTHGFFSVVLLSVADPGVDDNDGQDYHG